MWGEGGCRWIYFSRAALGFPVLFVSQCLGKFEWQGWGERGPQREREQKAVARGWLEKSHHKLGIWQKLLILCQGFWKTGPGPISGIRPLHSPAQLSPAVCHRDGERGREERGRTRAGRKGWKGRGETEEERDTGREKEGKRNCDGLGKALKQTNEHTKIQEPCPTL